jgi:hypothetical protein
VVQFLGVRSLVSFGATSTTNRILMKNEIERRKAVIVKTEYDVAKLMAAERQSDELEMFINYIIETGDKRSAKEGIMVTVSNPTRENFLLAKQLVYSAMRLIDDEIGIFHKRLDHCERPGRGSITIGSSHYDNGRK